MARKFRELEAKMSPEALRASDAAYRCLKGAMALEELRDALRMTQKELATALKVDQSAISKLEHRTDMYVSTLQRCIAAMGDNWKSARSFRGNRSHQPVREPRRRLMRLDWKRARLARFRRFNWMRSRSIRSQPR